MSRTTVQQDQEFIEALTEVMDVDASFVLDWVAGNFEPEDVFQYSDLVAWAEVEGFEREAS